MATPLLIADDCMTGPAAGATQIPRSMPARRAKFERRRCVVEAPGGYSIHVEEIVRPHRPRAKSILFVNGALASSRSFAWAISGLPDLNLIFYDLPHLGASKQYNKGATVVVPETEVAILRNLIDRYAPNYLASMSWGGVAALLALAGRPASVEKALVGSFSNRVTHAMRGLLQELDRLIEVRRHEDCAQLVNDTLGKHLPMGLKRANFSYLTGLGEDEREYIRWHIKRMLQLDPAQFSGKVADISAEILFINGALDEYTTWPDAAAFARSFARNCFAVIPEAGHFLTAESIANARKVARIANSFLSAAPFCAEGIIAETTVAAP